MRDDDSNQIGRDIAMHIFGDRVMIDRGGVAGRLRQMSIRDMECFGLIEKRQPEESKR
jgi:hypothetical protein